MAIRGSVHDLLHVAMTESRLSRRAALRQALFGAGAAGLTGLRPHLAASAAQEEPTAWIVGLPQDPQAIDPNVGSTTSPANVPAQLLLFDSLIEFLPVTGPQFEPVYALAESHEVISDTIWEFKLREGVKFHNGDDFTSADVEYTFAEFMDPSSAWAFLNDAIERVEVVDPFTVRFHTKGIQAGLLIQLLGPILPMNYREELGVAAVNENPVGTGPYTFVEWVRGERLDFAANANYWGGEIFPERLTIRPLPDPTTRVAELRAGGVHIIQAPPPPLFSEIEEDPNTELLELTGGRTMQYKINGSLPPFDDVRVRQAVNMAVDRDAIMAEVLEGRAVPMIGTFSEGWLGWDPSLEPYPYDPERARQLLAEAGYADGFTTNFNTTNGVFLNDREIAEAVAAYLAEVGITVNIIVQDPTKLLEDQAAGNFEGVLITPWSREPYPDFMLLTQYRDEAAHPDEQLNALIDATQSTLDPAEREARLQELNRYIHEQALNLEIHSQSEFWAKRAEIDWEPIPVSGFAEALLWQYPPK